MAPTIGRLALDNGFHGSIPGDWVAPPPQNIQKKQEAILKQLDELSGILKEKEIWIF